MDEVPRIVEQALVDLGIVRGFAEQPAGGPPSVPHLAQLSARRGGRRRARRGTGPVRRRPPGSGTSLCPRRHRRRLRPGRRRTATPPSRSRSGAPHARVPPGRALAPAANVTAAVIPKIARSFASSPSPSCRPRIRRGLDAQEHASCRRCGARIRTRTRPRPHPSNDPRTILRGARRLRVGTPLH